MLVISVFGGTVFSNGFVTGETDEKEIVLIRGVDSDRLDQICDMRRVDLVDQYGSFALVETGEKKVSNLKKEFDINRLDHRNHLRVKGNRFDTTEGYPDFGSDLMIDEYQPGKEGLYIIDMIGPVSPEWRNMLEERGVDIINYVSNYGFEAMMTPETAKYVEELFFVDWVGIYQPGFKLADDLKEGTVNIILAEEPKRETMKELEEKVELLLVNDLATFGTLARAEIKDESIFPEIARMEDVYRISNYEEPKLADEMATQIIGGGCWIYDDDNNPDSAYRVHGDHGSLANQLGYTGQGVVITVADTGIGDGTTPDAGHSDFTGRVVGGYSFAGGSWADGYGHGTHCTGSAAGNTYGGTGQTTYNDYYTAQGSAPEADIFAEKILDDSGYWAGPSDPYEVLRTAAVNSDTYVHSNSWGFTSGEYDEYAVGYDAAVRDANSDTEENEEMVIAVAAGNEGSGYNTLRSPGRAKNVITVGATQNYNPNSGVTNPDAVASFSSRGWTNDNRIKPDVMGPGEGVVSTMPGGGYGEMSGTSMSTPAVAGASAVVVDWYEDTYGYTPSPAMVRGLLINTAYRLPTTGSIPNRDEGWGMVNLPGLIQTDTNFILNDQEAVLETGDVDEYEINAEETSKPLKLTLTWTDKEGTGLQNNLNLEVVSPTGDTYTGNAFENDWTPPNQGAISDFDTTGDGYDDVNNVQNVYVHPDNLESGTYTVRVIGEDVPADGNNDGNASQDYALTIYNGIEGPSINIDSPTENEIIRRSTVTTEWTSANFDHNEVRLDSGSWIDVGISEQYTFEDVEDGNHTVEVRSIGTEGKTALDSVNFTVQTVGVDIVSPGGGEAFGETNVTVGWNSEYAEYHEIRRNNGTWENVGLNTSHTYVGLDQGGHSVDVRATDITGYESTDNVSFIVDTAPPNVVIDSPQEGDTFTVGEVNVEWSGEDETTGIDYYEVRLDGGIWENVGEIESHTFDGLNDGDHTVKVRATDMADNSETTEVGFTVDTTPPPIAISAPEEGDTFNVSQVNVEWSGEDETTGIDYYEVRLDGGIWENVGEIESHTFDGLNDGDHTVKVRATDMADNSETTEVGFTVDTTPPDIDIDSPQEEKIYDKRTVTIEWSGEDETTSIDQYEVRLKGGIWEEVGEDESHTFEGLGDGDYTVEVRATDELGNRELSSVDFTVDTTPPQLNIISPEPDEIMNETSVTLEWEATPEGTEIVSYDVNIDGGGWVSADSESNHTFESLVDGDHTVEVRAWDKAGNND
ncbi:MAG: S8 family serine peptidase, partial [Candidatus Thermoplasmatota archaeon]